MNPKEKIKGALSNSFKALSGKKGKGAQALAGVTIVRQAQRLLSPLLPGPYLQR